MSKTIVQKLSSAQKKLKQASRNQKAADHYINSLRKELEVKVAQLKSAEMFIAYLQYQQYKNYSTDEVMNSAELLIPMDELSVFAAGYETRWQYDKEKNVIVVVTKKKEIDGNK